MKCIERAFGDLRNLVGIWTRLVMRNHTGTSAGGLDRPPSEASMGAPYVMVCPLADRLAQATRRLVYASSSGGGGFMKCSTSRMAPIAIM
jgi:hypothetical protein